MEKTGGTPETTVDDEQKIEEGEDGEDPADDNETSVIETPVTETPEEDPVEEPTEDEVVDPTTDPEAPTESEEPSDDSMLNSDIMAVTPSAEATITVESKDDADATGTADVTWVGGCVDKENKLATGKDLRFRVALKNGQQLSKVEAFIGEATSATNPTTTGTGVDTIYTVAWDTIKTTAENKEVGRPVKIVVTTTAQTYDITFTKGDEGLEATAYALYPVQDKSDTDTTKVLGSEIATKKVEGAKFTDEKVYAIKAADGNKLVKVTINGTDVTVGKTEIEKTAAEGQTPAVTEEVPTISLKTSDYVKAGDTEVTVKVEVAAKAKLSASLVVSNNATASNGEAGDDVIAYTGGSFGDDIAEGGLKETSKLSFKVKANDNYKISTVTAVAKVDEEETPIPEADIVKGTAADDGTLPYTVSLKSVIGFAVDTEVIITVKTDYDDNENVHTVTFEGDLKTATITTGANEDLPDNKTVTVVTDTDNTDLVINVTPKKGYALPKRGGDGADKDDLVISVTKKVKYKTDDTYGAEETQTEKLKVDSDTATLTLVGQDNKYSGAAENADPKDYTVTSATVKIETVFEENEAEKKLFVNNQLGEDAAYSVQYAEAGGEFKDAALDETILDDGDNADTINNTWYIPQTAERVQVTVDTGKTPKVVLDDGEPLEKEAGDGYKYIFPAKNLTAEDTGSTLTISEADPEASEEAIVKVKVDTDDVTLTEYKVDNAEKTESLTTAKDGYYTLTNKAVVGKSISLTFKAEDGAALQSVSYSMDSEDGEKTGEVKADRYGVAKLNIEEVTGAVTVDVVSESAYVVKLYDGDEELEKDKDGVYEADYTTLGITIKLYKTATKKDDIEFYDVVVEDGSATAETGATIDADGNFATLDKIHKSERGKTLTIKVYKKDEEKPFEAKLRTNANSSSVKVTQIVNGKAAPVAKDAAITVPFDAQMTFKVVSEGASTSDLGIKLFKKDGTALSATEKAWFTGLTGTNNDEVSLDGDTFTITTTAGKDERDAVEVRIYNKNETVEAGKTEAALDGAGTFKVDVDGYMVNNDVKGITAAPGVAGNTTVRINLNTTFKDNKNLPAAPNTGKLYYKVVLDEISGDVPTGVTKLTGAALTKYYPLDDYANPAQTVAIELVTDARTGDAAQEDLDTVLSTTIKEVSLVQSVIADGLDEKATVAEADYVGGPAADIKDNSKTLTTKAPLYETKLTVKAVNGSKIFTGQENVKVATPVFGKDTGYDSLTVQFVNSKTGVVLSTAGESTTLQGKGFTAWVDEQDNSIYVSSTKGSVQASSDYYKNLGVKVIAAYPTTEIGEGYAATAVVKLKVQQGIYNISADETKAKLPETIYVKGKNASVKIATQLNGGDKDYKPAKAALDWSIDFDSQEANIQKNLSKVNNKGKAAPTISVNAKNGTVTVTKDYEFSKDGSEDTFTVTAKAVDFAGNEVKTTKTFDFTITDVADALTADSLVIVNASGEVKNAKALKAEDFDETLYVAALRNDVPKGQDSYNVNDDFMPVTIKSGAKANLEVDLPDSDNMAELTFKKPGNNLKINVNAVDGGKAKATLVVNIAPYENLGLYISGKDGSWYNAETETIEYAGGSNQTYTLTLQHKNPAKDSDDYPGGWMDDEYYKNAKVTVKGGKLISNKKWAKNTDGATANMGDAVVVTSADGKATITLTDNANRKTTIYKIQNTSFEAVKTKAPSIKLYSPKKITNDSLWNEDNAEFDPIVYQVTDKTKDNYAGKYVRITPDHTAANNMAEDVLAGEGDDITVAKVDENGRFEVYFNENLSNNGYSELPGGTYKMVATVCEMKRGEILPLAKDVKLSFSIPKIKDANTKLLNVTAKYTLDAKSNKAAEIQVKVDRTRYVVSEAKNVIKDAKVQGKTKDTHTNEFTKYFEVVPCDLDGNSKPTSYTIGLKDTLTAEEIVYITGQSEDKDIQKKAKEDCVGYITVSNGYYWYNSGTGSYVFNAYNTKDIKVTISFKENKYTVTGASVFEPKAAIAVNVSLMSGKNTVPVVAAALDEEDAKSFAASAKAVENGIEITSNATAEVKKHDVKLKVVPINSGVIKTANWNAATNKWDLTFVNKEGTTAYSEADLIKDWGVKVTAKIDVKAVDAKKVIKIKNLNVALSADNYEPAASGNAMGNYVAYVPYEFLAGNTDIATTADAVKLGVDKDGKDLNAIAGKTLITVAAKDTNATIYNDDREACFRITINKAVLQEQYEKTEANKKAAAADKVPVVTTYGAKLKVPVVLTYTNNGTTTETVNFNVTMPKKPQSFEEIRDILNGTTELGTGRVKRNIKTEIESIRTPQDDKSYVLLNGLLWKVSDKVSSFIPKDADVALTPDWSELEWEDTSSVKKAHLNDGTKEVDDADTVNAADYDTIMTAGKAKINLTLTNKLAAGTTAKLSYNFDADKLGVKHKVGADGSAVEEDIVSAIQDYLNRFNADDDTKLVASNDMEEGAFLNTIRGLDGVEEYMSDRDSVNIWLSNWKLVPATERKEGFFSVSVSVNDEESYTASIEDVVIARISNIGDVSTKLGTALSADKVKTIVDDCSGIEAKIKAKILTDAKKAIGNDKITVAYAQRPKTAAGDGTRAAETEDDFTYQAATADAAGNIAFKLEAKSETGRTVSYTLTDTEIPTTNAAKYCATKEAAVAAVMKAVVTSDPDATEENRYNVLKSTLATVDNTQEAVEAAVEDALKDTALAGSIVGWTAKNITVTYTPAAPDGANATKNPGKVTITADIVLKGDETEVGKLNVANAPVVNWKPTFQTAAQLKAAIDGAKAIVADAETDFSTDAAAKTKLQGVVDGLKTGTGLTVEYVYDDETTPAAYSYDSTAKTAKYDNVKIIIKKGGNAAETFTVNFTFSVKAVDTP